MSTESDIIKAVVKFVTGDSISVCRLCLTETNSDALSLEDEEQHSTLHFTGVISYEEMLLNLNVPKETSLPFTLCPPCAQQVSRAYLFQKFVQHSNRKWAEVLSKFNNALDLSNRLRNNVQTVYLLVEEKQSHLFTSHKNTTSQTKQTILTNVKTFIRQRKSYTKTHNKKKRAVSAICEECGISFPSKLLLLKHITTHQEKEYKCKQCGKDFRRSFCLRDHIERQHKPKKIQCSKCAKLLSSERLLKIHEEFEHKAAICQFCFMQLPSKRDLKQHMVKHGKPRCVQCGKLYANKHSLRLHKKNCGKEDPNQRVYCAHCKNNYKTKNALRTHLKIDHGFVSSSEHIYKCDWCDRKFDVISRWKSHIVKHTKERNFHCEKCGNAFVTKAALTYHTRLHTGERPFKCDMCDENFLSASRRMEHKRRKHLGPERQCPSCGSKFLTGYALRKHVARHTNPQSKLFLGNTDDAVNTIKVKDKRNILVELMKEEMIM